MSYGSLVDNEGQKIKRTVLSTSVAELYSFMKCFGSFQFLRGLWMDMWGEVAEIHMRTDAKNLATTARTIHVPEQKGNNPHDLHVAKGSLIRNYSSSCTHFNSKLFGRLLDKVIGESRQFDHSSENREIFRTLMFIQTWGHSWSIRTACLHGAEHSCTQGRNMFSVWTLEGFLSHQLHSEGPFHVMLVRTSMDSESQDATKITSALADPRIYSSMKKMTLDMHMNAIIIFLSISPAFSSSVVAMSTSRLTGVCMTSNSYQESVHEGYDSPFFGGSHCREESNTILTLKVKVKKVNGLA